MAPRTSVRRLSLDMFQRSATDIPSEVPIIKYMDLRLPAAAVVHEVQCECCGLCEDCTPIYIRCVRACFGGTWLCGLCSEAVKEESKRRGRTSDAKDDGEALRAHMEVCRKFNRSVKANPAMSLAAALSEILRKSSFLYNENKTRFNGKIERSRSCIPTVSSGN